MRVSVSFLLCVLALAVAGSAPAASNLTLSLSASGSRVLYGHHLTLSGRLSNGVPNRLVTIFSRPYGQSRFVPIGKVDTGATGTFQLSVAPARETDYMAATSAVRSAAIGVGVEPSLMLTRADNGALRVHVTPARTFAGRTIELQAGHGVSWTTTATAPVDRASNAVFTAPLASGSAVLRVAMSVNQAGVGYLGATTHAFVYRATGISLQPANASVTFGRTLTLSGTISSGKAGQRVSILARRYGSASAVTVTRVLTAAGGHWRTSVEPTIQTTYTASWDGRTSSPGGVAVRPALGLAELSNNRLVASVAPAGVFVGRNVELQRRTGTRWMTIAQAALSGARGTAIFAAPAGSGLTLRLAMSVNEAGAGYLAAFGSPLQHSASLLTLAASTTKVLYGHSLSLSGRTPIRGAGQRVQILAVPYGSAASRVVATVLTNGAGQWSLNVRPALRTVYSARAAGLTSRAIVAGVEPLISVAISNGRVRTHVASGRALRGRLVQLQELSANRWSTVARARLGSGSSATFPPLLVSAGSRPMLRVALSVNEAGAGLLGAKSHAFDYSSV